MAYKDKYISIPVDISGSRTKSRFRFELLWGLSKALDFFEVGEKFAIVFDYLCDIEVHLDEDRIEFYQVKTSSKNELGDSFLFNFTSSKHSVIGKLCKFWFVDNFDRSNTYLALVSNMPLKINKNLLGISVDEHKFSDFNSTIKDYVVKSLECEFDVKINDLDNLSFIHTDINLKNPERNIIGQICEIYIDKFNLELSKPNGLYRFLLDEVNSAACYEQKCQNYSDLIKFKGIKSSEIEKIFESFNYRNNDLIQKIESYIEENYKHDIFAKRELIANISTLVNVDTNLLVVGIVNKMNEYIYEKEQKSIRISTDDLLKGLVTNFKNEFPIEYTLNHITVYALYSIFSYLGGQK